jgi:transposase-like protein
MGLSRRQFTKEFKLAAVRRLEQGVSMAEVARGLEVNANVLHRWRRELRRARAMRFQAMESSAGRRDGSRIWSGRSGNRLWRSIF